MNDRLSGKRGRYGAVLWHDFGGPSSQIQPHLVQPDTASPKASVQARTHKRLTMPDPRFDPSVYDKRDKIATRLGPGRG
jgi:hypothetical protein